MRCWRRCATACRWRPAASSTPPNQRSRSRTRRRCTSAADLARAGRDAPGRRAAPRRRRRHRGAKDIRRRSATPSSTTCPGLLLIVEKQLGANTLAGDARRRAGARDAEAGARRSAGRSDDLPAGDVHRDVARQSQPRAADRLRAGRARAASFFLADWRTALISSVAIPLSLLAAAMMLRYRGGTHRHDGARRPGHRARRGRRRCDHRRREHRPAAAAESAGGASRGRRSPVVFDASLEVRSAVVFGSLIVMLVFLPVFMLEGLSGAFFRPLATAYVLAILVVAARRADDHAGACRCCSCPTQLDATESRLVRGSEGLVSRARCRG